MTLELRKSQIMLWANLVQLNDVTLAGERMVSRVPEPKLGGFNPTELGLGDNISMQHWIL